MRSGALPLSWSAADGAILYRVFRGTTNHFASASEIGDTSSTQFDDFSASPGAIYHYWVLAEDVDNSLGTPGTSQMGHVAFGEPFTGGCQ